MRSLKQVHKHKLVHKESKLYVGYRLTALGYDYLALRALVRRGVLDAVGRPLGVGKEADVFVVSASEQLMEENEELGEQNCLALKIHRLGRTSFRAVKSKRDYLVHRKAASWIYLSRLAAIKEYAFMCALHQRGFPVPRPFGQSRHIVVMELVEGSMLTQVHELPDALATAKTLVSVAVRFAEHGLVHCDLNEFNILVDDDGEPTVIDFPQMVSTNHAHADELFNRDIHGIRHFFSNRFGVPEEDMPCPNLQSILSQRDGQDQIDCLVSASGFKNVGGDGKYGVQDVDDVGEGEELLSRIDLNTLQLPLENDVDDTIEEDASDEKRSARHCDGAYSSAGGAHESARACQVSTPEDDRDDVKENDESDVPSDDACESQVGLANTDDAEKTEWDQGTSSKSEEGIAKLNYAAIEARVRRQRANQQRRRQFSKRNTVKDSQKRKIKVEVQTESAA